MKVLICKPYQPVTGSHLFFINEKKGFLVMPLIQHRVLSHQVCCYYAPNFEKVGGHIGFGLSVCMYKRTYVFMFEISS